MIIYSISSQECNVSVLNSILKNNDSVSQKYQLFLSAMGNLENIHTAKLALQVLEHILGRLKGNVYAEFYCLPLIYNQIVYNLLASLTPSDVDALLGAEVLKMLSAPLKVQKENYYFAISEAYQALPVSKIAVIRSCQQQVGFITGK